MSPDFANGAITGAFGYLFNDLAHDWANRGAVIGGTSGAVLGGGAVAVGEGTCVVVTEGGCAVFAPAGPGAIAGGSVVGAGVLGWAGYKIGGFLGSVGDWLEGVSYNESAPNDTPTGTRPIDQWGIGRGDIHDIKEGIGAEPADWVGVSPGGEVITTGPNGEAVNNGHVDDYTNRPLKQFPRPGG